MFSIVRPDQRSLVVRAAPSRGLGRASRPFHSR